MPVLKFKAGIVLWLLFGWMGVYASSMPTLPADVSRLHNLSRHVDGIEPLRYRDHTDMVRALVAPARSDAERAWLVYRWVTQNFRHDNRLARRVGSPERHALEDLIRLSGGSCEVYAHVTSGLLRAAGLEVQVVKGRAKSGFAPVGLNGENHVWNLVRVDGRWWVMDTTWGAGYVSGGRFYKDPSDLFFLMPPEMSTLSHYDPQDRLGVQSRLQLTPERFAAMPEDAIYLASLGVAPEAIFSSLQQNPRNGLVDTFNHKPGELKLRSVPLTRRLARNAQSFQIETAQFEEMFVVQGRSWIPMNKSGRVHHLELKPVRGELLVMGRRPKQTEYEAILAYEVQ
ncbi:MAG TPA: transglutaminase domain-containing protein [Limnobacter sp.]|nr:transglutaminase domain-containing protein [Limnobacter sp.]